MSGKESYKVKQAAKKFSKRRHVFALLRMRENDPRLSKMTQDQRAQFVSIIPENQAKHFDKDGHKITANRATRRAAKRGKSL